MADKYDDELVAKALAWGMTPKALSKLMQCDKGAKGSNIDTENHHLRFEAAKIFMRVRINAKNIEERLSNDIAKAREERDKRLLELGFNITLFNRNQAAYNARKQKR